MTNRKMAEFWIIFTLLKIRIFPRMGLEIERYLFHFRSKIVLLKSEIIKTPGMSSCKFLEIG